MAGAQEGLRELEELCVMELVHPESGEVIARTRLLRAIRRATIAIESKGMYLELPAAGHEQAAVRRRVEWLRRQGSNL